MKMNTLTFFFALLFSSLLIIPAGAQTWIFETVDQGSKPEIALGPDGQVHIAYMLESNSGFVKHAQREDGAFSISQVTAGYFYGPLDIGVDGLGTPHIVYHDHDDADLEHYVRTNGTWTKDGVPHPGHDGWDTSIAFDADNNPHIASVDPSSFGGQGVEYAWYNDAAGWQVELIGSGPIMYANATSIAIGSDGTPHITYYDDGEQALKYAAKSGGAWSIQTIDNTGDAGRFASLVLDEINRPRISYFELGGNGEGIIKFASFDGSAWTISQVDVLEDVVVGFTGARNLTSLFRDANQQLHLAYSDRKIVKHAVLNNDSWEIETVTDLSLEDTDLGQQTSLAVDANGNIHLTYFEVSSLSPLNGNIIYAYKNAPTTSVENISKEQDFVLYPNPARDKAILESKEEIEDGRLRIFSLSGKTIKHINVNGGKTIEIETTDLTPGIYYLGIANKKGEEVFKKLVIE